MTTVLFRLWAYEYLAQLFDGAVEHLPDAPDSAGTSASLCATADAMRSAMIQSSAEDVLADHARLFVNARDGIVAPPYASWYLDGQLLGPSVQWVERAYAEQGLERTPDAGEPPDYLGAELEFLLFLTRHELAARSTGDAGALRVVLDSEKLFVLNHVALWLPAFLAQIHTRKPGPVFRAAGDFLGAVVQDDVRRLSACHSKPIASSA
ncbi:MAG: molecular chaperone TorD family protein [Acidobacteria bacterium]|nr:molecular chaperone TorD family protein [Acidobacteriota bacterium]